MKEVTFRLLTKALIPFMKTFCSHYLLISQRPHLKAPSHWRLEFHIHIVGQGDTNIQTIIQTDMNVKLTSSFLAAK